MLTPENRELLRGMSRTQYGKALKAFLDERYSAISDITTCKTWEETVGRQFAIVMLKEMFSFMEDKDVVEKKQNPNPYT